MSKTEKKKMLMRHQRLLRKTLDYNENVKKLLRFASKVDRGKSEPNTEESIADRMKLRRQKLDIIAKTNKKGKKNRMLFNYYFDYLSPDIMFKRLRDVSDKKNKNLVESIDKNLTKMKNIVKNVPKDEVSRVEENEKIIDIVEKILELNSKKESGKGLKILTPNQMLSRLPITLAQLKAGNNSEKLKNEIRQLLYSLYRSKKLTKQL